MDNENIKTKSSEEKIEKPVCEKRIGKIMRIISISYIVFTLSFLVFTKFIITELRNIVSEDVRLFFLLSALAAFLIYMIFFQKSAIEYRARWKFEIKNRPVKLVLIIIGIILYCLIAPHLRRSFF